MLGICYVSNPLTHGPSTGSSNLKAQHKLLHFPYALICPSPWVTCQLSQLPPSSDPNQLITFLSGTAPFPRDKCAGKFSSPRALHTPASSPHWHSQRRPCERKTIWQKIPLWSHHLRNILIFRKFRPTTNFWENLREYWTTTLRAG